LNWPSYAGGYWLLVLIAGVTALACMSQLAFMIALVRQAIRDPLTGILSRGSGTEILHLLWSNAEQNNSCLALAFFDIDHFKSINDTYGHEAGDRVLQEFTGNLQARMRGSDTLLRWGGEEFLLVMPNTDMHQARRALRRLTESGLGMRPDGTRLTASIGLAERCADRVSSPNELLELADHRMYRAKTGGRDQIRSMPDGMPEPEAGPRKAYCSGAAHSASARRPRRQPRPPHNAAQAAPARATAKAPCPRASSPLFSQALAASPPRYTRVSMTFLALYLLSASRGANSISRPGRTKAYSPMRRTTMSAASSRNTGASASPRKPTQTSSGTAESSTRTPRRLATRPVMNSWEASEPTCTSRSSRANTRTWLARSENSASTSRACSKYRKVVVADSSTTNRAMPAR